VKEFTNFLKLKIGLEGNISKQIKDFYCPKLSRVASKDLEIIKLDSRRTLQKVAFFSQVIR
jgi:hypothetical protein